jgi:hypothetical protein
MLSGKSRTVQFEQGKVSFRSTQGRNEILDMPQAVAWMWRHKKELVRVVETVTVTDVLKVLATTNEDRPGWLRSTGPGESITINTGVDVQEG